MRCPPAAPGRGRSWDQSTRRRDCKVSPRDRGQSRTVSWETQAVLPSDSTLTSLDRSPRHLPSGVVYRCPGAGDLGAADHGTCRRQAAAGAPPRREAASAEWPGSAAGGWARGKPTAGHDGRRSRSGFGLCPRLPRRPVGPARPPQTAPSVSGLDLASRLALLSCEPARHLVIEPPSTAPPPASRTHQLSRDT
jgi:hypothetical protein